MSYVDKELAARLKVLGFREKSETGIDLDDGSIKYGRHDWNEFEDSVSMPSLSEVCDWLRINKNILISPEWNHYSGKRKMNIFYFNVETMQIGTSPLMVETDTGGYDEMLSQAIDLALKYLEERK